MHGSSIPCAVQVARQMRGIGAVFGLLVGLVVTHELLVGYRLPSWSARVLDPACDVWYPCYGYQESHMYCDLRYWDGSHVSYGRSSRMAMAIPSRCTHTSTVS